MVTAANHVSSLPVLQRDSAGPCAVLPLVLGGCSSGVSDCQPSDAFRRAGWEICSAPSSEWRGVTT